MGFQNKQVLFELFMIGLADNLKRIRHVKICAKIEFIATKRNSSLQQEQ